jgi:hypothetical protein
VRVSSMEEWNQRISTAYSQLSLGTRGTASTAPSSSGAPTYTAAGQSQPSFKVVVPQQVIRPFPQSSTAMVQSVGSGLDGLNSVNESTSSGSMRSLSSMDVCSPYKKVKFCLSEG